MLDIFVVVVDANAHTSSTQLSGACAVQAAQLVEIFAIETNNNKNSGKCSAPNYREFHVFVFHWNDQICKEKSFTHSAHL